MKTRAIALAVLFCSGAALAQNPFGDDSGPNANDGQCDDTRFENLGAGNSNIVFWEGGRYDGRDATDCRDLLLQGLINWRDGVDSRVDIVLAMGAFGDDSGPNANDGQCDDTRFENLGAGNSKIVFWEGGRYDGRDATDCADLLLQGLIAWRRDTAVAVVPSEPEVSTVSEAQQQEATTLPEDVTAESVCTDNPEGQACWMELDISVADLATMLDELPGNERNAYLGRLVRDYRLGEGIDSPCSQVNASLVQGVAPHALNAPQSCNRGIGRFTTLLPTPQKRKGASANARTIPRLLSHLPPTRQSIRK